MVDDRIWLSLPHAVSDKVRESRGGEMADAPALGAGGGDPMEVQVLSTAPCRIPLERRDFAYVPNKKAPFDGRYEPAGSGRRKAIAALAAASSLSRVGLHAGVRRWSASCMRQWRQRDPPSSRRT